LKFGEWHAAKYRIARESDAPKPIVYFGLLAYAFSLSQANEFSKRLKFSNDNAETISQLLALRQEALVPLATANIAPSEIYRLLQDYSDDALAVFQIAVDDAVVCERVQLYRTRLRTMTPEITGNDLKQFGIQPGPVYREILDRLRNARLDGEISTRAEEEEIVRQFVAQ